MLGSPHARALQPPRARVQDVYILNFLNLIQQNNVILRGFLYSIFFLHSFHPFTFTFEREIEFCTVQVRQSTKRSVFFVLGEIILSWETNCQ